MLYLKPALAQFIIKGTVQTGVTSLGGGGLTHCGHKFGIVRGAGRFFCTPEAGLAATIAR